MKVNRLAAAFLLGRALIFPSACVHGQTYTFVDVLYPGANETIVTGVNDAGVMVGAYGPSINLLQPIHTGANGFIFDGTNWQSLQAFGSSVTEAQSINNAGTVVGQYLTAIGRLHGFVYNGTQFFDILPQTATEATVSDIDDNGVIIGTYSTGTSLSAGNTDNVHAFRGNPDGGGNYTFQLLPDVPTATSTFGGGRNVNGTEVGTGVTETVIGTELFGYVRSPTQTHKYQYPAEFLLGTQLFTLNNAGTIVGSAILVEIDEETQSPQGRLQPFLLNASDFEQNDPPAPTNIDLPGPSCGIMINPDFSFAEPCRPTATNINDRGQIVGFYDNDDGIQRGFIGTSTDVGPTGDYNGDGIIDAADYVIWRKNNGTQTEYETWRRHFGQTISLSATANATIPEPATLIILLSGTLATFSRNVRKCHTFIRT